MVYKDTLVVEDDPSSRTLMRYRLEDMGIIPDMARSREEAIELAKKKPYQLCISDGLYGEWILLHDEMKSFSPGTKFILLSGDPDQIDIAKEERIECYDRDNIIGLLDSIK